MYLHMKYYNINLVRDVQNKCEISRKMWVAILNPIVTDGKTALRSKIAQQISQFSWYIALIHSK